MDELDVWRAAQVIINRHGADAELVVARRVDHMIARGNADGEEIWRKILAAIRELQKNRPPPGEARH
jgi:hypothetical protein